MNKGKTLKTWALFTLLSYLAIIAGIVIVCVFPGRWETKDLIQETLQETIRITIQFSPVALLFSMTVGQTVFWITYKIRKIRQENLPKKTIKRFPYVRTVIITVVLSFFMLYITMPLWFRIPV